MSKPYDDDDVDDVDDDDDGEEMTICDNCGAIFPFDESQDYEGQVLCDSCYGEIVPECGAG